MSSILSGMAAELPGLQAGMDMCHGPGQYHNGSSSQRSDHEYPNRLHTDFSFNLWLSLALSVRP